MSRGIIGRTYPTTTTSAAVSDALRAVGGFVKEHERTSAHYDPYANSRAIEEENRKRREEEERIRAAHPPVAPMKFDFPAPTAMSFPSMTTSSTTTSFTTTPFTMTPIGPSASTMSSIRIDRPGDFRY